MNMRIFWIAALSVVVFAEAAAVDLLEQAQLQQGVGKVEFVFRNGRRMLRLTGRTPKPRPNGNAYLKFRLKLAKPVSLTGKAVRFRVEAARSPEYGGVIFNAFAPRAEKPAWSLMRWDKRLFSRHSLPYVLSAGSDRTLKWQTPPGADGRVDRLEFMFGSPFAGKEGEFYISEISVGPEHSPDDPVIQLEAERLPFPTENVEVVADRRFSGGKGIRLRDGVTDGAVEAQFQVHPGHYILSLTVAAEESVVREMKKMVNNADSPRLGIFCDDGPRRQRVVIYAHEAHNPFKERDVMDLRLTGGETSDQDRASPRNPAGQTSPYPIPTSGSAGSGGKVPTVSGAAAGTSTRILAAPDVTGNPPESDPPGESRGVGETAADGGQSRPAENRQS